MVAVVVTGGGQRAVFWVRRVMGAQDFHGPTSLYGTAKNGSLGLWSPRSERSHFLSTYRGVSDALGLRREVAVSV